jgi:hypothetical protein
MTDLLVACRLAMSADGYTIMTVNSATLDGAGATYAQYLGALLPAVRAAGLALVHQIVAAPGPGPGDEFLYYATSAQVEQARMFHDPRSPRPVALLVFTNNACRA